jgi:MFS family permease
MVSALSTAIGMLRRASLSVGMESPVSRSQIAGADESAVLRPLAARAVALPFPVSLLVLFFAYWCVDIVSPALPTIQASLSLSGTGAGLVFSVFFAGRLVTNLPAAWLVERVGPKWTAVCGAAALMLGSLLAATATTPATLLPARGVQGVGVALLATAGLLSVLRARPGGGAAMTAFNVSSGLGGSFGLLSGGYLAAEIGWRAVFWLSSLVSGVLLASTVAARVRSAVPRPTRPDNDDISEAIPPSRSTEAGAVAANLLVFGNYAIWIVSIPLLGAIKFNFNAGQVGLLLLFVNVVHLLSAMPIGGLIRKVGAPRALAVGFGVVAVGLLLIPLAPSVPWLLVLMALYSIGQVAGNSSAGDLILRLGGGGGRAVGAVRLSSDIGLVAGPALAGALADVAGVEAPFFVLGILALAATLACGAMNRRRPRIGRLSR